MNDPHFPENQSDDDGIKLLDILQTLAENARLLIFGPLIIGLVALGVSFLLKPSYVAKTTFMTPQQQQGAAAAALAQLSALAGAAGGAGGAGAGAKSSSELYLGLLKSRTIADKLVDRFGIMKAPGVETREDAQDILKKISGMAAGRDGLITVGVVSRVPGLSAALANAYVEELRLLTSRLAVTEAQQRRQFLEKEVAKVKENLGRAEAALGGVGVGEEFLKYNPMAMGEGLATLKAQMTAKELQLSSMRGYFTENSPNFRQVQRELAALRGQLDKYKETRPAGANGEYITRYRDYKYNEVLFEQLSKQYELAKVDESGDGAAIQVVDVAVPPTRNSNMSKALIFILFTLGSGFVLLVYVFVRRALKNAGQDPENAEKLARIRAGFGRVLKPWRRQGKADSRPVA